MSANFLSRTESQVIAALPPGRLKDLIVRRGEDVRFVIVGGIGFVINLVALWILHGRLGLPLFIGQLIAAELALLSNFSFHHNWTYQNYSGGSFMHRLGKFHATAWAGALIGSLGVWVSATYGHIHYLLAVVVGALLALGWNYFFNKYVIWGKRHQLDPETS